MQVLRDAERLFVVDYAHTPDALIQVLANLKTPCQRTALGGVWLRWRSGSW